ncbi:MAG: leucine-rich repeat domain-containing protein, partial [Anaeroplasmataceae bacterium]|nr:leucine-rich repeat domain-containing protein [Anaeroplasmataceae bacterium]
VEDEMSNTIHTIVVNDINYIANCQIQFIADYSYLNSQKVNEMIGSFEYHINPKEDFEYTVTDLGVVINKYVGSSKICEIPVEIEGTEVTSIGRYAFAESKVQEVILPNCITSIGAYAFGSCSNLINIKLPSGITSIEEYTFEECESLESITLPNSLTSIGKYAFFSCEGLMSIEIPDSVTSIENNAFEGCSSLKNITLPSLLTSIGEDAFFYCNNLTDLYYKGTIEGWCKITFVTRNSNPMYYASHFYLRNSNNEWEEVTEIVIPEAITEINAYQFIGFNSVKKIQLSTNLTRIGNFAFYNCSSLTSITIPISVLRMGDAVFNGCNELVINCEANSKPSYWSSYWVSESQYFIIVNWGFKQE